MEEQQKAKQAEREARQVGFGGFGGKKPADANKPAAKRKVPPPPKPEGSTGADIASAAALLLLAFLVGGRAWQCHAPEQWRLPTPTSAGRRLEAGGAHGSAPAAAPAAPAPATPSGGGGGGGAVGGAVSDFLHREVPMLLHAAADKARAAEEDSAAAARWFARSLLGDVAASCDDAFETAEGSALYHALASAVGLAALAVLLWQLGVRAGRRCCPAVGDRAPLLPTAAAADGRSDAEQKPLGLAPWSSLALCELFLASYASGWFAEGTRSWRKGAAPNPVVLAVFGHRSLAHALALGCAALLLLAAARRALQIWWWTRAVKAALEGVAVPPKPKPKPAATAPEPEKAPPPGVGRRGGAPPKGQKGPPPKKSRCPAACLPLLRWCKCASKPPPPTPLKKAASRRTMH
jgi:hypothetical protein